MARARYPTVSTIGSYLIVVPKLAKFLLQPCTPQTAAALLRRRMAARDALFLQMVRQTIWQRETSPYQRLLLWAGWPFHRVAASVRERGVEATLEALRDAGVYVSHEEFKGRTAIVRDGLRLDPVTERDFYNPSMPAELELRTGGTRSRGSRVPASLQYIADQRAPAWCLTLEALQASSLPVIIWLPRDAGYVWWLSLARMGRRVVRWFSITRLTAETLPRRYRLLLRMTQALSLLRGLRVPFVEEAGLGDGDRVLAAVFAARTRDGGCVVVTSPSAATRLASLADRRGRDLAGVVFVVGGEPLTPGKHAEITRSGARVGVRYNLTEAGAVGGACAYPADVDDVHFLADSFALIRSPRTLPGGLPAEGFMLTTLLPSSPEILLNVDSDDFGALVDRRCGCVWDALGMHTHLSRIRSFSKLTGEGMSILGTDVIRIVEEVLPQRFGGRSTDYQLLEVEDADHLTRLQLVVSPGIGAVDEAQVMEAFIGALSASSIWGIRLVERWLQAGTIQVVRREPVSTSWGKLLPFHTLALTAPVDGAPQA